MIQPILPHAICPFVCACISVTLPCRPSICFRRTTQIQRRHILNQRYRAWALNRLLHNRIIACTESRNGIIRHTFHSSSYTVAGSFIVFLKMLAKPPLWSVEFMVCLSSSSLSPPISISVSVYLACLTANPPCVLGCIVDISPNPHLHCNKPGLFFLHVISLNFAFCCGCIHMFINVWGITFIEFRHASVLWLLMHC